MNKLVTDPEFVAESLQDQARNLEQEARMILPGMQALFGFQLVAVFSARFTELDAICRLVHLGAILLSVVALALAVTPAAYHREVQRKFISKEFIRLANRCLCWTLLPLSLSISLDVYVIGRLILTDNGLSLAVSAFAAAILFGFWFALPMKHRAPPGLRSGHVAS